MNHLTKTRPYRIGQRTHETPICQVSLNVKVLPLRTLLASRQSKPLRRPTTQARWYMQAQWRASTQWALVLLVFMVGCAAETNTSGGADAAVSLTTDSSIGEMGLTNPDQQRQTDQSIEMVSSDVSLTEDDMAKGDTGVDPLPDAHIPPTHCEVVIAVNLPDVTEVDIPLFLAGNFCQQSCETASTGCCDWVPNDPQFTDRSEGRTNTMAYFQLRLPVGESFEYKLTQGAWTTVEREADCSDIPNRSLSVACPAHNTYELTITVAKWTNQCD
jgi:hypothetical protein